MVVHLFPLENQSYTVHPLMSKLGVSRLSRFCYDSASTSSRLTYQESPFAYHAVTASICQWLQYYCANCQHSPSCFLREPPEVCGLFSPDLVVRSMVMRPLSYCSRHSGICQWIRSWVDARTTRHLTTRHLTARHFSTRHHYISPPFSSRQPYISPPLHFASTKLLFMYI
jgi:hypothetical protein